MRIGIRARGGPLGRSETERARDRLRWALGPHVGSVAGATVRVDVAETPRCQVRLRIDGPAICAEATAATVADAIDLAIHRAAAAAARAIHTRRLLGREEP